MSRELLKRAVVILHDHFDGVNWAEPLLNDIDNELAQPEPEPVAWVKGGYLVWQANLSGLFDYSGWEPLYTTPPDQTARIAELIAQRDMHEEIIKTAYGRCEELEKDNNITHENLAWYMEKYHEHLTIIAEAAHSIGINHE